MKLSLPIFIAASAIPVAADAWSMGGGPRMYFGPSIAGRMMLDNMNAVESMNMMRQRMQQKRADCLNNAMTRVSPRYEIKDSEKDIMVSLDVPGVKAEDIHVTIEDGNSVLSIRGQRESSDGTSTMTRRFFQSFSLDPAVDLDKFTATLNNGVLVITAPKDLQRLEKNLRRIPITTGGGGTTTGAGAAEDIAIAPPTMAIADDNGAVASNPATIETPNDDTIDLDDTSATSKSSE